ncbi:MAG: hypothetical protein A2413_16410 [Treponema sp. RIFOXYC1_FULL_61_9]|nr:MAG: hypothetical protein A2001_04825 [Treponema sp. GWC1_61_84]OHE74188.1 MAG: hypothetical protein A2413_16410 [Treponema sp. RIFOXYC1_FULL_61_9]
MIDRDVLDDSIVASYSNKAANFRFRSCDLRIPLSHGLFSSSDIDSGTRLLLKSVSDHLDELLVTGAPLPTHILDAGCGTGVVALSLAAALLAEGEQGVTVRAQDRDELARAFTAAAARANELPEGSLLARCEPLLSRDGDETFDLIVSNLPAKAGPSVLRDFFRKSAFMLSPDGFCIVVIVNPLAADAREWLGKEGNSVIRETKGKGHTVFRYGPVPGSAAGGAVDPLSADSPYRRVQGRFELLSDEYGIEAIHGARGFDERGREKTVAARLLEKCGLDAILGRAAPIRVLVFANDQGHFSAWLAAAAVRRSLRAPLFTLLSRNILSLSACSYNVRVASGQTPERTLLAADFGFAPQAFDGSPVPWDLVVVFPEIVPLHEWTAASWSAAARLVRVGGLFVLAASSSDSERFDRVKTGPFDRAGELKRDGFKALAYRRAER